MALTKHDGPGTADLFDRIWSGWPTFLHRPLMAWPATLDGMLRVEEYKEGDDLVIRAEAPGVDPEKDVEVSVADSVLHIEIHRRVEEKAEDKSYYRSEFRYGSFTRDLALPEGCTEADVSASYTNGVLEIRVPATKAEAEPRARKIPVTTG